MPHCINIMSKKIGNEWKWISLRFNFHVMRKRAVGAKEKGIKGKIKIVRV